MLRTTCSYGALQPPHTLSSITVMSQLSACHELGHVVNKPLGPGIYYAFFRIEHSE